jgi:dienelactone hydrolase
MLASAVPAIACSGPSGSDFGVPTGTGGIQSGASGGSFAGTGGGLGGLGTGGVTAGGAAASGGSAGTSARGGNDALGGGANAGAVGVAARGGGANAGRAGAAGNGGSANAGAAGASLGTSCETLPPVTDYAAKGPFADAKMFTRTGPNSNYTVFRPDASLGKDGFKHPIAAWGNGISTTPDQYAETLTLIATHGFVIVACNDTQVERPCISAGLDWLVEQDASGPMMGKLDTTREATIGYSWGGGGAIDTADRANVKATVSLHGMPPRVTDAFAKMHAPLLLFTSTGDTFVSAQEYVTPNYEASTVQTFYATLADTTAGHLYVVDEGAAVCLGAVLGLGTCGFAAVERAPMIAWLRLWTCGDQNARKFFYGDDCTLCQNPWTTPRRKEWK